MRVRQGWSGEVSNGRWAKVSVELDDVDVSRVLHEEGLLDLAISDIPATLTYQLLDILGERYVMAKLMSRYDYPYDQGMTRLGELNESMRVALAKLHDLDRHRR